jgi:hypothetical protein
MGPDQNSTWSDMLSVSDLRVVCMSSDGKYLAAGGINSTLEGFVVFYANANIAPYPTEPLWDSRDYLTNPVIDLALSDDGFAVVAISQSFTSLHYWANATTLSGDANATWSNIGEFSSLDMSADGNNIVAGSVGIDPLSSLHFWSGARAREGVQVEDWIRLESTDVLDVAISDDGLILACSLQTNISNYTACLLGSDGTMIQQFSLAQRSPFVSMSEDGRIIAVSGPGWDSLYVFELLYDDNPPKIMMILVIPSFVHPEDSVSVGVLVKDDYSGVKQVVLSYTTDNETWLIVNMTHSGEDGYNATIPPFPYCTNVTYNIIVEDNYNNTISTAEMGIENHYHVIPEFTLQIMLPLFIITTLLAMALRKRKFVNKA